MFKDRGNPCGLFNASHIIVMIICLLLVSFLLYISRNLTKDKIKKISKISIIIITILELIKISYNFIYGYYSLTYWAPISYCAIFILAMYLFAFGKDKVESLGASFIACAYLPGLLFIIFPLTSLTEVPIYHYLAIYSFVYHSAMLYFSILFIFKVIDKVNKIVFINHTFLVIAFFIVAILLNSLFDINLMFASNVLDIPIKFVYDFLVSIKFIYTPLIILIHIFFPYLFAYILSLLIKHQKIK